MLLAPTLGEPPRAIAERLGEALGERLGRSVEKVEIAGPGFLNLFMADAWYLDSLAGMREAGEGFGSGGAAPAERVNVEFVSANPTGPLHIGHARNGAYGDALARILGFHGHDVTREFYVNDYGSQVLRFGESLRARARGEEVPEGGYQGDYVTELAAEIPGAADMDLEELGRSGVEQMVDNMREALRRFRVEFDVWTSERTLHPDAVEHAFERLAELGQTFRSEGALWVRTSQHGDDKDRVIERSSGEYTYFASDIAYHQHKRDRGYDRLIDVWGADHHGYVRRVKAVFEALGGDPDRLELVIMQFVHLVERGGRAQMSKRAGTIVTLDELVDDIGDRRGALVPAVAQPRHDDRPRPGAGPQRVAGQPRLLRPVRARADRVDPAQGGGGAGGGRAGRRPARERRALPPVGARAREAAARVPRRGGGGRCAPRAAPDDHLRARDRARVLGLLPRLPRGRSGRGGRRRGRADRDLRAHARRAGAHARPARAGGARVDVGWPA